MIGSGRPLAPRKFSSFAVDETVVLVAGLALVGLANLVVLRVDSKGQAEQVRAVAVERADHSWAG